MPRAASLIPAAARGFAGITELGNIGKTPGVAALFSCAGSEEPDSSYV
jgi:hypothetical protein